MISANSEMVFPESKLKADFISSDDLLVDKTPRVFELEEPYDFDELAIFNQAKQAIEKLVRPKLPDPEVLKMSLDINWSYLGEENDQILRHLIFTGGWDKLLELIPEEISFD